MKTLVERFEEKFIPEPMSGCWLWTAALFHDGYGQFYYKGKNSRANRVSYDMNIGPVPPESVVRHTCDNPPCVNPDHLRLGTVLDNNRDAVERGRHATGERSGLTNLCGSDVIEIRRRYESGETQDSIAVLYGITQGSVGYIVRGKVWRHVGGPIVLGRKTGPKPKHLARS